MLADTMLEEGFDMKEEEMWYDKKDLEHDLHLAAELGKTLLERNRELEQGLQKMYSTNQEQLLEIEYLTKQVDLLRQVNDQHAKVYEQLDMSARELEQNNHKLHLDNKAAQQKIEGLTETVEGLQTQVEELQHEIEELKTSPPKPQSKPDKEMWRPHGTQSVSCLKELQNARGYSDHDPDELSVPSDLSWHEEQQASLRRSLRSLQTKLANERAWREEAEREANLLAGENSALEQQLGVMEGCRARLTELECEAEELRQLWRAESSAKSRKPAITRTQAANCVLLSPEEEEESEGEVTGVKSPRAMKHHGSKKPLEAKWDPDTLDRILDHERSCVRRSEVVKYRGISLLNEVDAQYSALQVKYDELLRRHQLGEQGKDGEAQSHKAVQTTSALLPARFMPVFQSQATGTDAVDIGDDFHQPEYKELFKEIFTCIRKTVEDLSQNRVNPPAVEVTPLLH
ncbi:cerebellar degeneration-related protein 2-like [Lampris incognitus]|uniref:cerebellar degeneration-related protein 2-like n=1 Tax=Lampris incognitus TaxID=2546036 RepID=UPI0024B4FEA9|nr:cerebellar degeneration-related protein 2-like [Lampris incognitus]